MSIENQYLPLLQTLLGGILATVGGLVATSYSEYCKQKRSSRNLAIAFKGEIFALKNIVQRRKYLEDIDKIILHINGGGKPPSYNVSVTREYFAVYKSNVSQIGILKAPLPYLLANFYTQGNAIIEDLDGLRAGKFLEEEKMKVYSDLKDLFMESMTIGDQIISEIDSLYPS